MGIPENLEDIELILRSREIAYKREGGALVYNFTSTIDEHELVIEIHEPYETILNTRILRIYIPALLSPADKSDPETETQIENLLKSIPGKTDRILDGSLVGIGWSIPLNTLNHKEDLGNLFEKIISIAGEIKPYPLRLKEAQMALNMVAQDSSRLESNPPGVLKNASRFLRYLISKLDPITRKKDLADYRQMLGEILSALYYLTGKEEIAMQSEEAFRGALAIRTGVDSAITLQNLGTLFKLIYEFTGNDHYSENCENVLKEAIKVRPRTISPKGWAWCQHCLGSLFKIRFDRSGEENDSLVAESGFRNALEVFTKERYPQEWGMTVNSLGNLYTAWYRETHDENDAIAAVQAYLDALKVRKYFSKGRTFLNMAGLYSLRNENTGDIQYAKRAEECLHEALTFFSLTMAPKEWASIQLNLGHLYIQEYHRHKSETIAEQARECYLKILGVISYALTPSIWVMAQFGLASLSHTRFENTGNQRYAEEAIIIFSELLYSDKHEALNAATRIKTALQMAQLYHQTGNDTQASRAFKKMVELADGYYNEAVSREDRTGIAADISILYEEYAAFLIEQNQPFAALVIADAGHARALAEGMDWANEAIRSQSPDVQEKYRTTLIRIKKLEEEWQELTFKEHQEKLLVVRTELISERKQLKNISIESRFNVNSLDPTEFIETSFGDDIAIVELAIGLNHHAALCWKGKDSAACIELPGLTLKKIVNLIIVNDDSLLKAWDEAYTKRFEIPDNWENIQLKTAEELSHGCDVGWLALNQFWSQCSSKEAWISIDEAFSRAVAQSIETLKEILWHPLLQGLGTSVRQIGIVLPGLLHPLPVHASAPENLDVSILPSIKSWIRSRLLLAERKKDKGIFFARPNYRHKSYQLPATILEEALTALQFLKRNIPFVTIEGSCSTENIIKGTQNASYFHFAGHGLYNWNHPWKSSLILDDTLHLNAQQLRKERTFQNTVFSVLSACQTGMLSPFYTATVKTGHIGNEFVSLPAALIETGSPAVIASQWSVSDIATAFFMDKFYHYYLDGDSSGTALRKARIYLKTASKAYLVSRLQEILYPVNKALITETLGETFMVNLSKEIRNTTTGIENMSSDPPFNNCKYWAPFVIYGNSF